MVWRRAADVKQRRLLHGSQCRTDLLELNTFKRWVVKRVPGLSKELNRDPTTLPPNLKTDTVLSLDMNPL